MTDMKAEITWTLVPYETPETDILTLCPQQVMCASGTDGSGINDLDHQQGSWN